VQHAPLWFHWFTALATLVMELGIVLMLFLPRRFRLICFFIVTPWEIGVISTANYAFLNYLVLALGFLLLDDKFLTRLLPRKWFPKYHIMVAMRGEDAREEQLGIPPVPAKKAPSTFSRVAKTAWLVIAGTCFAWVFYATSAMLVGMLAPEFPLWRWPVEIAEPSRIASQYGLFGVMTRGRYEIEFQGSNDGGKTWTAYPFRYKPQTLNEAPRIYAPYQPRFDWNLWFASLDGWRQYPFVLNTEEALLDGSPEVLSLFRSNPFAGGPPKEIRCVIWQYWFTSLAEKRATGDWWTRKFLGLYAPTLIREAYGRFGVVQIPEPGQREDDQ
jgi:lipase maturation factor 1